MKTRTARSYLIKAVVSKTAFAFSFGTCHQSRGWAASPPAPCSPLLVSAHNVLPAGLMVNPVFPLRVAARLLGGEWSGRDGWNMELGKSSRLAEAEKPRWSPRDWRHGWVQLWCAKARRSECCNWYQFRTERCPSLPARPAWRPARLGLACFSQSQMSNVE